MRPISNIVDITNFVMLETGHPMHAFDLRDVRGAQIIVRQAKRRGASTLDGKGSRADAGYAGNCGRGGPVLYCRRDGRPGQRIKPDTTEIFFESAKFRRDSVRRTARALGMRTESSARFEKGMDIINTEYAMERALQLIDALDAGDIVDGVIDCNDGLPAPTGGGSIRRQRPTGLSIPGEEMAAVLNRLCIPTELRDGTLHCEFLRSRGYGRPGGRGHADLWI